MKHLFWQLVRFGIVGGSNTVIDVGIYTALTRFIPWFGDNIFWAASVSFIIAGLNGYYWNKRWTFKNTQQYSHQQLMKFYIAAGIAYAVNQSFLFLFIDLGIYDVLAKALSGISAGVINFAIQRFWTFRHSDDGAAVSVGPRE